MEEFSLQIIYLILVSCAMFIFYLLILENRRPSKAHHTAKLPPSPTRLPIIGHLHHLLTEIDMPHHSFAKLSQKLGGAPIIYVRLGRVPTVVISSARLAELVLKTHDHVFANRPQLISAQYLSFGCSDITFSSYGPYWRQARKICVTELLSSKRVNSFELVRNEEVNRMLQTVLARSNSDLDLSELFFKLANDILCRVAFGKRFIDDNVVDENTFSNRERGKRKKDLVGVLTETQALLAGFSVGDFFPGWEWVNLISGTKKRLMKNLEDLRMVCDEIINEHLTVKKKSDDIDGGDDHQAAGKEDFVDVLLRVQKRTDLEVSITDDNLKALVLDMFVAGTDTSSATLEWTMTELARHPKVMKKAQEEVRQIAGNKGKVDEADLQNLNYLRSVIKETMRIHPPVPLLVPRESIEECFLDGYCVPARTRVLINTFAIGRDPKSWKNPMEFIPERFVADDIDFKGQDFKFLPFGGGRRGCPGYSFGLATVQISLARLLFHFDWSLPNGAGTDDLDLSETFGLATRKKVALKLIPTINSQHPLEPALQGTLHPLTLLNKTINNGCQKYHLHGISQDLTTDITTRA